MPTNTLSPNWMNNTLEQKLSQVNALGFTTEGVNKVFRSSCRNEKNFLKAVNAICSNVNLIKAIRESCKGITPKNLETLLHHTDGRCADVIKALHKHRGDLAELMGKVGFSGTNISSMIGGCGASNVILELNTLTSRKEHLRSLIGEGFSAKNVSSLLSNSGYKLSENIQVLIDNLGNFELLMEKGFSASNLSSILNASGPKLSENICALIEHADLFLASLQSRQLSATDLRPELRKYAAQISKPIDSAPQVEQAAEVVAAADPAGSSIDEFVADLAGLLLLAPNCSGDLFLPTTAALVKHRNALLQLHTWCGFSANHIAGILNHSEANLGKAIGELSGKATLLFGLIQEGHFTAGELAEKLHGSGDNVGVVFGKDPTIRAALHASHRDLNGKRAASATVQEADLLNDAQFFEVDDSDISLSSFSLDEQIHMPPAAKCPRFAE